MDKLQKVLNEVERLQNELITEKKKGYGSDVDDACILELQNIKNYIKFVQEEPVSEELEEAAMMHYKDVMERKITTALETANMTSFKEGAKWQKEQMMAKAVNGNVIEDIEEGDGDFLLDAEYLPKSMGLKDQQKVKVIVIKED